MIRSSSWAIVSLLLVATTAWSQAPKSRTPIPDEAAQAKSVETIRDVYKADYAKATRPDQKAKLANKMVTDGLGTKEPTDRYVMLRIARDLAVQAGNLDAARKAIQALGDDYDVEQDRMLVDALEKLATSATLADLPELMEFTGGVVTSLSKADQYDEAQRAAAARLQAARRTKDMGQMKSATAQVEETSQLAKEAAGMREALATLEKSPADEAANLTVGRFYCFFKEDWKRGVPMLALSGAEELSKIAQDELTSDSAAKKLAVADGWFTASEKEKKGPPRTAMRRHALELYIANVQSLSGISAKKVAVRIEELERELPANTAAPKLDILQTFSGHSAPAFSPDNRYLITSDSDGGLHLRSLPALREVRKFDAKRAAFAAAFTASGDRVLVFCKDKQARLFDVESGAELRSFEIADDERYMWLSPDAKRCYLLHERVRSYDIETGKLEKEFSVRGGDGGIYAKMCNSDGRFAIASGISNTVRITDLLRGGNVSFDGKTHCYGSWISPDAKFALSCGGDAVVRMWSVATTTLVAEYKGAEGHQYMCAMTPDGTRVVSGGGDKCMHVWDVKTGEKLHTYRAGRVLDRLKISPSGLYAATANDGAVMLFGLPPAP